MSRSRFTPRQRTILLLLAAGVVLIFGLLGYSVATTIRQMAALSPLETPTVSSPLVTPSAVVQAPSTPSPTPGPTATRPVPLSQIQSARAVHEVGRIVAQMRELSPVEQIPVSFLTEDEAAILLLQQYQQDDSPRPLDLYAVLGLIPPFDSPLLPDVTLQASHISTLYVPDGRQMLLVAGRGPATPEDEWALVYALVHALQDGEFGLRSLTPCSSSSDATLALRALVEGDAVFTAARYAGLDDNWPEVDRLAQMSADALEPTYAPLVDVPAFQRLRLFPYQDGSRLVAMLYEQGEWAAVDQAYARPPCSTRQVLHPELYLNDTPVQQIPLPDLGAVLGDEWQLARWDTIGELLIGLHLAAYLDDAAMADEAAAGWAGDSFELWQDADGRQLLAWRIAWADRDQAAEFEQAYALIVPRLRVPPLLAGEPPFDLSGRLWSGPAGAVYLTRAGRIVTVVWAPDVELLTDVAVSLP